MKYKIIEINKSGLFEIHKEVRKRKLTFIGFKHYTVFEKMYINFIWNGTWTVNLWNSSEYAKTWILDYEKWKNTLNKEETFNI